MRTFSRLWACLPLAFVLQACEVSVDNGRLPPEYIPAAKEYVGTYVGEMDGRKGSLVFSVKDDGYVEVATPGFEGGDIYDVGCGSVIGPLQAIEGKERQDHTFDLERLVFGYHHHAWQCISQNQIRFDFGKNKQGQTDVNASLVLFYTAQGAPYTIYGYFVKQD